MWLQLKPVCLPSISVLIPYVNRHQPQDPSFPWKFRDRVLFDLRRVLGEALLILCPRINSVRCTVQWPEKKKKLHRVEAMFQQTSNVNATFSMVFKTSIWFYIYTLFTHLFTSVYDASVEMRNDETIYPSIYLSILLYKFWVSTIFFIKCILFSTKVALNWWKWTLILFKKKLYFK